MPSHFRSLFSDRYNSKNERFYERYEGKIPKTRRGLYMYNI